MLLASLGAAAAAATKPPVVVATIRPLAALVAGVMEGVGNPLGLIPANQAPESFTLHRKDLDKLRQADLLFWAGPSLEAALARPLANLEIGARIIDLSDTAGLLIYQSRHGGEWEGPSAPAQPPPRGEGTTSPAVDGHFWLDADNAKLLIGRIAEVLTDVDFGNAETYRANAARLRKQVDELDQQVAAELAPLRDRAFLLLRDDLQYWEARYGLDAKGSIGLDEALIPPARLEQIAAKIEATGARCVIGTSAADGPPLAAIGKATGVRTARIDPYGGAGGGAAFLDLLRSVADGYVECLGGGEKLTQRP